MKNAASGSCVSIQHMNGRFPNLQMLSFFCSNRTATHTHTHSEMWNTWTMHARARVHKQIRNWSAAWSSLCCSLNGSIYAFRKCIINSNSFDAIYSIREWAWNFDNSSRFFFLLPLKWKCLETATFFDETIMKHEAQCFRKYQI